MNRSNSSGVAMFAVLGTILLVTALGFVGMELAQRDQAMTGDVQDARSRDEALDGAFQLAVNLLSADSRSLATELNKYLSDVQGSVSSPRCYLDLSGSRPVHLVSAKPPMFSIGSGSASVRVLVAGVSLTAGSGDSSQVLLLLQADAQGRHGDQKSGYATYRVDGLGRLYQTSTVSYVVPNFAAYFGPNMAAGNVQFNVTGGMFMGASAAQGTNRGFNSGAGVVVDGPFKWPGPEPLTLNSGVGNVIEFKGPAYIRGGIWTNANATIQFDENSAIDRAALTNYGGFSQIGDPTTIIAKKNLWIGGTANNTGVNCGGGWCPTGRLNFNVTQSLAIEDLSVNHPDFTWGTWTTSFSVGNNLYLQNMINRVINVNAPFTVGGSVFLGPDNRASMASVNLQMSPSTFQIGGGLLADGTIRYDLLAPLPPVDPRIGGDINGRVTIGKSGKMNLSWGGTSMSSVLFSNSSTVNGGSAPMSAAAPLPNLAFPAPTAAPFSMDPWMALTDSTQNPAPQLQPDSASGLLAHMQTLESLCAAAGVSPSNHQNNVSMSALYAGNRSRLYNGYLVIHVTNQLTIDDPTGGVVGKFVWVIDASVGVNSKWPPSATSNDIQIIVVRGLQGGNLDQWGFTSGDFYGMLYWDHPVGRPVTLAWGPAGSPTPATLHGSIVLGPSSDPGTYINGNASQVNILLDQNVFADVAVNLPGLLQQPAGKNMGTVADKRVVQTLTTSTATGLLRPVTNQVWFAPVSLYH